MKHTKMMLSILGIMSVCVAWASAHTLFWLWLLGSSVLAICVIMLTSIILPALGIGLWLDAAERKCTPNESTRHD